MPHFYTQPEREQLLMALLDISLDQFFEGLDGIEVLTESDPVNVLGGNYVAAMREGGENAGQVMFQAICTMSDETLHRFVWCFGNNPLPFEPPLHPTE